MKKNIFALQIGVTHCEVQQKPKFKEKWGSGGML